ncbi:MAG: hypothetical protein EXS14_04355 [Planctomycetes bacterium]|nr:hypothetical protein [Planctomycetota bacterium]
MSFARPEWLWLLLPAVLLLWVNSRPKRKLLTTHLLLERALRSCPAQHAWRVRWQHGILFAALLAALLSLAGMQSTGAAAPLTVLVSQRASLLTCLKGETAAVRALRTVEVRLGVPRRVLHVQDPVRDCAQHVAAGEQVVLVLDQAPSAVPKGVGLVLVGDDQPNAGITALGLDSEGRLLISAAQRGVGVARTVHVVLRNSAGIEKPLLEFPLDKPRRTEIVANVHPALGEVIVARIEPADALPDDDAAELSVSAQPLRIGLPLRGEEALHKAFAAQERVILQRGDGLCDLRVGAGAGTHRLVVHKAATAAPREAVLAGSAAHACAGEMLTLALAAAPKEVDTLLTHGAAPLLVRRAEEFVLLADPATLDGTAALPLLCADLLALLRPQQAWQSKGVLDADASAGARVQFDSFTAPTQRADSVASWSRTLLLLCGLLCVLWLLLRLRAWRRA